MYLGRLQNYKCLSTSDLSTKNFTHKTYILEIQSQRARIDVRFVQLRIDRPRLGWCAQLMPWSTLSIEALQCLSPHVGPWISLTSHQSMIDTEKDGDYEDKSSAADVLQTFDCLCNVCKSLFDIVCLMRAIAYHLMKSIFCQLWGSKKYSWKDCRWFG